jgi:hypothetical protein
LLVEGKPYPFQRPVFSELAEVSPNGFFGRQITGNQPPLATGFLDVEEGIKDFSQGPNSRSAPFPGVVSGQQGFDLAPLGVSHVTGIAGTHATVITIKSRFLHRF